jgi:hypothetical protein
MNSFSVISLFFVFNYQNRKNTKNNRKLIGIMYLRSIYLPVSSSTDSSTMDLPVEITPEQYAQACSGASKYPQASAMQPASPCLCKLVSTTTKAQTTCFCKLISEMMDIPRSAPLPPLCYPCACDSHSNRMLIQVRGSIQGQACEYIICKCPRCHTT